MAGAFISQFSVETSGDNLILSCDVVYYGSGLGQKDLSPISVTVMSGDTLATIKQKFVDAVIAEATRLGYSVTAASIILPAFQKGA